MSIIDSYKFHYLKHDLFAADREIDNSADIPEELESLSDTVPQYVLRKPECLLDFLASPQVDGVDEVTLTKLMDHYDTAVGMEAYAVSIC